MLNYFIWPFFECHLGLHSCFEKKAFCTDSITMIELQWRRSVQQRKMIEQAYLHLTSLYNSEEKVFAILENPKCHFGFSGIIKSAVGLINVDLVSSDIWCSNPIAIGCYFTKGQSWLSCMAQ